MVAAAAKASSSAPMPPLKVIAVLAVLRLRPLSRSVGRALNAVPAGLLSTPPRRPATLPELPKSMLPCAVSPPLVVTDTPFNEAPEAFLKTSVSGAPILGNAAVVARVLSPLA